MEKYFEILKKCPLFEGIGEENLSRMLECFGAKVIFFDKKYTVMAEGSVPGYIGIVLSGSLQMVRIDYYGNRSIVMELRPSQMFGEAFACSGMDKIPVSVVADEPGEVMLIDSNHILHTCNNNCGFHQQLIYNIMKELAVKTISFHQRIEVTSKRTTREKLMAYLLLYAKKAGKNSFEIPFDRQELADYLEVDRSGLSAEISKLRAEGVLESSKSKFKLL
ncbi:MAG: Crp/Fnr family transcriptional regulator [Ruminococcaceae bacterium]|nr:Crp/Fnr family transcriptional regulator [Oscillospiraceae bacterium]